MRWYQREFPLGLLKSQVSTKVSSGLSARRRQPLEQINHPFATLVKAFGRDAIDLALAAQRAGIDQKLNGWQGSVGFAAGG